MKLGSVIPSDTLPAFTAETPDKPASTSTPGAIFVRANYSVMVRQVLGLTMEENPNIRLKALEKTVRNLDGAGMKNLFEAIGVLTPAGTIQLERLFARGKGAYGMGTSFETKRRNILQAMKDGARVLANDILEIIVSCIASYLRGSGVRVA